MNAVPEIPGADEVVAWFGGWPSFHDAEVLEFLFVRKGTSYLRLHAWVMTDQLDARGYYVLDKHAVGGIIEALKVSVELKPGKPDK